MRSRGQESGFTLVEMLIVVVIMGILAGIVVIAIGSLSEDADKNTCRTDQQTYVTAVEAFKVQNKRPPTSFDDIKPYVKHESKYWTIANDPTNVVQAVGSLPASCTDDPKS